MVKHMSVLTFLVLVLLTITVGSTSLYPKVQVGEDVVQRIESPHPYSGLKDVVWEQELSWANAGYIAIHFSNFDLAEGDYVEISSPDGKYVYTYNGKGKVVRGGEAVLSEFWATHIPGDTAFVRLISSNPEGGWGFQIDRWVHGYERQFITNSAERIGLEVTAEVSDNYSAALSSEVHNPAVKEKSKAMARLLVNGKYSYSGFLINPFKTL